MFKRFGLVLVVVPVVALVVFGCSVSCAFAGEPWWHLSVGARPSYLPPEGMGQIVLTAVNLGDASVAGEASPVRVVDTMPAGLKAVSVVSAFAGPNPSNGSVDGGVFCSLSTCTFGGKLPPFDEIQVVIGVEVLPGASSGEAVGVSISGGGAPPSSVSWPVTVAGEAGEAIPFGLQENAVVPEGLGGAPDTQAGSHPFQITDTVVFNQRFAENLKKELLPVPVALPKDIRVKLPPGLIGNPQPLPRCTLGQFLDRLSGEQNACPAQTAIGVASVLVDEPAEGLIRFVVPLFNVEPAFGEPARFGFMVPVTSTPVLLDASVRSGLGEGYGVTVSSSNISQIATLLSSEITFWGVPGDSVHDAARGWGCLRAARGEHANEGCQALDAEHPPGFLIMPTSCTGPLQSSTEVDSWADPGDVVSVPVTRPLQALDGCNQLAFDPSMQAEPTTESAA
jgi:hypothetical protein